MSQTQTTKGNHTRGSGRYNAKFTESEVIMVHGLIAERERLRKEASNLSNAKIAEKFDVCVGTINNIAQRKTWAHV